MSTTKFWIWIAFAFALGTLVGAAGIVVVGVIVQTRIDYVG